MEPKLQKFLANKYRGMFSNLSAFGFECGDGWYDLLDQLCGCIQNYCGNNKISNITINQIKEKFGTLRFYYDGGDELIAGMVWFAEYQSALICEGCGKPSKVYKIDGWYSTNCKKCRTKK
jgi:hypothetical protein